jgi:hypothetical protein
MVDGREITSLDPPRQRGGYETRIGRDGLLWSVNPDSIPFDNPEVPGKDIALCDGC